jgi:hypothetical protein
MAWSPTSPVSALTGIVSPACVRSQAGGRQVP